MTNLSNLNWKEYEYLVSDGEEIIFIPVGALEQHGPHMSMNPDIIIPSEISLGVTKKIKKGLIAEPVSYGYKSQVKSGAGNFFSGTTCINGKTLIDTIHDIIVAFSKHGNKKFVLVNGHFENSMFIIEGIDLAIETMKNRNHQIKVILLSYWDFVDCETIKTIYPEGFTGWEVEHGGVLETSLMLYLRPELVNMSKVIDHAPATFPPYDVFPSNRNWVPSHGTLSSAKSAKKEYGEILFSTCVDKISEKIEKEFM